ncbi:uncharacterized protein FMAN_05885 [Fusarium mangiferae]|uniref:Uncharacterized protein n=1 Tax=Fusarium mangiferae TaxID=192010 RepID=A0A1L7SMI8_FUSMA|nr:uncharacterized protein FMAN_05885 [Fusarium mangiferae]CVK86870.1 uncharacterized protein FMAN_05885 [Fusarium mangiferae]
MAILAAFFRSFEGVVLSITAIHIVLTTLSNWICRPATPTPEELIRSRRENHTAGRSAVNRVVEAAPRTAAGKHPYHKPCHRWWWYAMALWPAPSDRLCRQPRRKWRWYIVALWPARDDPNRWFILITALSIRSCSILYGPLVSGTRSRTWRLLLPSLERLLCSDSRSMHWSHGSCHWWLLPPRQSIRCPSDESLNKQRRGKSTETWNHGRKKQSWVEESLGQLNDQQRCRRGVWVTRSRI